MFTHVLKLQQQNLQRLRVLEPTVKKTCSFHAFLKFLVRGRRSEHSERSSVPYAQIDTSEVHIQSGTCFEALEVFELMETVIQI